MRIDHIEAKSILDTRGKPTIETVLFANTFSAVASVPSGKSTGQYEAFELRDSDGGVSRAIENVNGEIARAIIGRHFNSPDELDASLIALDGTPNKSRLGANAILSVSIAAMRLSALLENIPLWSAIAKRAGITPRAPCLYVNVMNGGVHACPAEASAKEDGFRLPFQEYILVVDGKTSNALPVAQKAFEKLGQRFGSNISMGDEGGYAPAFETLEEPFEILSELVKEFPGTSIAIDSAASELFHDGAYQLLGKSYTPEELAAIYRELVERFSIHSIEDPFAENAPADFSKITASLGNKIFIIGDDLTVTDPVRIKKAARNKEINAVLIKPNQIGTVRESLLAVKETYTAGFQAVASHRSGETDDTFIADFAYGIGAHGIKAGGFGRPSTKSDLVLGQRERLLKYERLLAIEREAETI